MPVLTDKFAKGGEVKLTLKQIIKKVENEVPHNISELKSKILNPIFGAVTSVNFIIGIIAVVILLLALLVQSSYDQMLKEVFESNIDSGFDLITRS